MSPPTRLHYFERFRPFFGVDFCKIQTFQKPGSDRRTHESALRILTKLPAKRELAYHVVGNGFIRSVTECINAFPTPLASSDKL